MSAALTAPAVAAAPATGGASLILALLTAFGPSILEKLGLFGKDPNESLKDQLRVLLSPAHRQALQDQITRNILQGSAFNQGLGAIATGANTTANTLAKSLAARGITGSGTRDILTSMVPSITGSQIGQLKAGAEQTAAQTAADTIKAEIEGLYKTSGPSQGSQYTAAGVSAFTPFLAAWLKGRYPGMFGAAPAKAVASTAKPFDMNLLDPQNFINLQRPVANYVPQAVRVY